jgi:hypothetical protein
MPAASALMPLSFREAEQPALNCGAGWYPARRLETGACWPIYKGFRRVTNPPQVANLPHNSCRIPVGWENYAALGMSACATFLCMNAAYAAWCFGSA